VLADEVEARVIRERPPEPDGLGDPRPFVRADRLAPQRERGGSENGREMHVCERAAEVAEVDVDQHVDDDRAAHQDADEPAHAAMMYIRR